MANSSLNRTISSPSNADKVTISAWVKRSAPSSSNVIIGEYVDSNNRSKLQFKSDDTLEFFQFNSGSTQAQLRTNRLFRDVNAWYHIVFQYDSAQASSSDRIKLWINGFQETSFSIATYPSQNIDMRLNKSGADVHVGEDGNNGTYFDGYISHIALVDNAIVAPTSFGSTDSTSGIWKFKPPSGVTWGNNGFHLKFENSGALGTDSSGNTNTFTVNGNLKQALDTPSNVYCTINPLSNKIAFNLANGNTTLNDNGTDDNDNGIACSLGVNSGKFYWEMKKGSGSGGVMAVITDDVDVRLGNRATNSPDPQLWGFQSNGTGSSLVSYIAGTFNSSNALQGWGANDIIGYALDMDNGKLYVSINGVFKGLDNNTSDPANGTNPAITGIPTGGKFIIPYFEKRSSDSPETMCNFGNGFFGTTAITSAGSNGNGSLFEYDVPNGYYALNTKNINTYG